MSVNVSAAAAAAQMQRSAMFNYNREDREAFLGELLSAYKEKQATGNPVGEKEEEETYWEKRTRLFKEQMEQMEEAAREKRIQEAMQNRYHYEIDENGNVIRCKDGMSAAELLFSML